MGHVRIKIPGVAGKIEARAARMSRAVREEWERAMAAKAQANKPKTPAKVRRAFAHIRDYREVIK
jgi:hypothetical protein